MAKFTIPEVDAKYSTEFNMDQVVHMPGYGDVTGFRKKLKDLSLAEADALFGNPDKNNLLSKKPAEKAAPQAKEPEAPKADKK